MHIDLNSCFATIEQQANPLLRGKPVVVAAYGTAKGFILSPSIEAKKVGIKMGMQVGDAQAIYPKVVVLTPDAPKYRDVHLKFKKIFSDYSPKVVPKSIDEAVIDFTPVQNLYPDLIATAQEIKVRMKKEIGEWIWCSIGIGPNRFLAKTAASFKKPDGLIKITHENVLDIYQKMQLTDLNGINVRYESRLNLNGIFTPLQFFDAPADFLRKKVFKSVVGEWWHSRLRGWEVDNVEYARKSFGQQYALGQSTADPQKLSAILMKLCEKMGRRLRHAGFCAQGIHVAVRFKKDYSYWHLGKKFPHSMSSTQELYQKAQFILDQQPLRKEVGLISVTCFELIPRQEAEQFSLFYDKDRAAKVSDAMDLINNKYGEYVITSARMMGMKNVVLDRIAFGRIRELESVDVAYIQ